MAQSLAALETLPGVSAAVQSARTACTEIRWHNALRRRSAEARAEATVRSARNSAALEGARYPVDLVRDAARGASALPDDASGQLAQAAIRTYSEAAQVEKTLATAPAQALARLHLAAAGGLIPAEQVGRPRQGTELPGDGIGEPAHAPVGAALGARLNGITDLLSAPASAPALIVAALVHAEILTARPFIAGNGLVARAAAHAVVVGRGLDPMGVVVWEAAHLDAGPGYHRRLQAYTTGSTAAVADWLVHCADAVVKGAQEGRVVCDAVTMGRVTG
nr:Fic family protein [Kineosporia babensis]